MDNPANDHGGPATASFDKSAIRAQARAARAAFGPHPIAPPPELVTMLAPGLVVASYIAVGDEADPRLLAGAALAAGCRLALPHVVDRATPMRFLAWTGTQALLPGPFGLHQPEDTAGELAPDLILAPLVAFDGALNRIGQGAGYYDRAFARLPDARRIGVAYSAQQVAAIAPDPWDVPLGAVITEQGLMTP